MQRLGRTHRPFYRINAVDGRVKRDGKVIERLGWYNPVEKDPEKQVHLDVDKVKGWLERGAQPSDTVRDMLGHRDLLNATMKAEWEADRATGMARGRCKAAVKSIESAIAELEKIAEEGDEDAIKPLINTCKRSLNDAKRTLSLAKADEAEGFAKTAAAALGKATAAQEAAAKAKAEAEAAEAKAAEEAAKAEVEAEAEARDGHGGAGDGQDAEEGAAQEGAAGGEAPGDAAQEAASRAGGARRRRV